MESLENFGSWSVLTTNFLVILYVALGGVTFSSILHLVNGRWRFEVRNLASALAILFPIAGVLLLILLAGREHTFPWLAHADAGHHLPGWLNYNFLVAREVLGFAFIVWLFMRFIKLQELSHVDHSYKAQRRYRNTALLIPFAYVIYGSMVAWDFEMTLVQNWHSASYGFYHFQSNFHMFLGFFTVFLFFLNASGKLVNPIAPYIFNYMAQFMLGMTILWTYLYFTQYLIMWYGRLPDEMGRYDNMMLHGLGPLWWTFLALKFIIPFCTLAITPNRHNPVVVACVATSIVLGTWIERYTWISGSVDTKYYHIPMTSVWDVVYTVGLVAVCWIAVRYSLARKGLIQN